MRKGKENTLHIGIYGRRNNGKSSLINKIAGQEIAIVSQVAGTTTDLVKKSFELTGYGPIILVDTAGIDDAGYLGEKRIERTIESLKTVDFALLIITANNWAEYEDFLVNKFNELNIPYLIIHNKSDIEPLHETTRQKIHNQYKTDIFDFNTTPESDIEPLIQHLKTKLPKKATQAATLVGDLISYGDLVLLITPIDIEAPAGRLILPQVQTIRDILDNDGICIVLKEREIDAFLRKHPIKPKLAITDSQIFLKADAAIPKDIPLTSFSILLARQKGDFSNYLKGTPHIAKLQNNDHILLLESCTHHVACDDIARVKIPRWISSYTGKKLNFDIVSGLNKIDKPITEYAMVIQCGGCMITEKQLQNRLREAIEAGIPVSNYGMTIAYVQGIYNRAIAPFIQTTNQSNIEYL